LIRIKIEDIRLESKRNKLIVPWEFRNYLISEELKKVWIIHNPRPKDNGYCLYIVNKSEWLDLLKRFINQFQNKAERRMVERIFFGCRTVVASVNSEGKIKIPSFLTRQLIFLKKGCRKIDYQRATIEKCIGFYNLGLAVEADGDKKILHIKLENQ